jgi:hypothetical protein
MARIKSLLFAVVALGLLGWNLWSAMQAAPSAPSGKGDANGMTPAQAAVMARVQAHDSAESVVAMAAATSQPLQAALAALAKAGKEPATSDASALKQAADAALTSLPESSRKYVVVAVSTSAGALAVVPGHDPLVAGTFPWIDDALTAGAQGKAANVAGHAVQVYAAPVRAVVKDDLKDLGAVAIAFGREPADLTEVAESSPWPLTVVANKAVVASSDKAHSAEVASLSAPGNSALKGGGSAQAFRAPGYDNALLVMTASTVGASGDAGGAVAKNLKISLGVLGVLSLVFIALAGEGKRKRDEDEADADPDAMPRPTPVRLEPERQPVGQPQPSPFAQSIPSQEPSFGRMVTTEPELSTAQHEPVLQATSEPEPEPAPLQAEPMWNAPSMPASDPMGGHNSAQVPGFDELFGTPSVPTASPIKAPPPPQPQMQPSVVVVARPDSKPRMGQAMPSSPPPMQNVVSGGDPLGFLGGPLPEERTSQMPRELVASLAAQSGFGAAVPLPAPTPPPRPPSSVSPTPSPAAIPLPSSVITSPAVPLPSRSSMPAPMPVLADAVPLPSASSGKGPDPFAMVSDREDLHQQPERTVVAAVPQELLRAAGGRPQTTAGNGPGVAAPLSAQSAEELHFQDVYREFLQTRERCGEPQENLTFEKFAAKLRKNKEQLVQKYACKSVRFQVYVKEGKAALKATPVKEA